MALITVKEYARRRNISRDSVLRRVLRGRYETAVKLGRDWFVDEDEEFVDQRLNSDKVKVEIIHE